MPPIVDKERLTNINKTNSFTDINRAYKFTYINRIYTGLLEFTGVTNLRTSIGRTDNYQD